MEHAPLLEPLMHDERALRRIFRQPTGVIRQWLSSGELPARKLPDGRAVVLHDELLAWLRELPRP